MGKLDNVSLRVFRRFLKDQGLECTGKEGGHEIWSKEGMTRPVVIQTHIDPVKRLHIKTNLDSMQVGESVLLEFLGSKKQKKANK